MAKNESSDQNSKAVLPSEVEGLRIQHNLTAAEAERVARGESVEAVKGERVVFRTRYEQVEASASSHPLIAADAAAQAREEEAKKPAKPAHDGPDPALPSSGPYGPNAEYESATAPEDKDHLPAAASRPVEETVTRAPRSRK